LVGEYLVIIDLSRPFKGSKLMQNYKDLNVWNNAQEGMLISMIAKVRAKQ